MNLFTKQTHRFRKQTYSLKNKLTVTKGETRGER